MAGCASLGHSSAEVYFLFVWTRRALRVLLVHIVPVQSPLGPQLTPAHGLTTGPRFSSAPEHSSCCRTQAHIVGWPACGSHITMPVAGFGACWTWICGLSSHGPDCHYSSLAPWEPLTLTLSMNVYVLQSSQQQSAQKSCFGTALHGRGNLRAPLPWYRSGKHMKLC